MDSGSEYQEALEKAMVLLDYNDRTCRELRERLIAGGFSEEAADEAVEHLKDEGLLDDERYAGYYFTCWQDKKSIRAISGKLAEKGIDEEIIDRLAANADESAAFDRALKKQLASRHVSDISEAEKAVKKKIAEALYRQGFSCRMVRRVFS